MKLFFLKFYLISYANYEYNNIKHSYCNLYIIRKQTVDLSKLFINLILFIFTNCDKNF